MEFGKIADTVVSALNLDQESLATSVARLSSGLRINTAADDPSGLAIATNLQAQAAGLDQGANNVQTGVNALTVADGAMETITQILQRMRSLIVEGRSDLLSDADRNDLTAELQQLGDEINKIAEKTNFNGTHLLDGSATPPGLSSPGQGVLSQNDTLTSSGLPFIDPTSLNGTPGAPPLDVKVSIDGVDPTTGDILVTINAASSDSSFVVTDASGNPDNPQFVRAASGTNFDDPNFGALVSAGILTASMVDTNSINGISNGTFWNNLQFVFNNVTAADVGKSAFIYTTNATATSSPLEIGVGDHEGDQVAISLPVMSTSNLQIQGIQLTSNDVLNEGAEYRLDAAIQTVVGARAQLGAQTVSLQETQQNTSIASTNLTASASAIRDLNVASETTTFTRLQIQQELGTRLLSSMDSLSTTVYSLLTSGL
jgi:flagellin